MFPWRSLLFLVLILLLFLFWSVYLLLRYSFIIDFKQWDYELAYCSFLHVSYAWVYWISLICGFIISIKFRKFWPISSNIFSASQSFVDCHYSYVRLLNDVLQLIYIYCFLSCFFLLFCIISICYGFGFVGLFFPVSHLLLIPASIFFIWNIMFFLLEESIWVF